MSAENRKDAALLLALSENGRPVEVMAQFLASYQISGELDTATFISYIAAVLERTDELISGPGQVWPGLLPGPATDLPQVSIGASERTLTPSEWDKLERCERPLYSTDPGGHAYTDVMRREDSQDAAAMWDETYPNVDATTFDEMDRMGDRLEWETARRVARMLLIRAFGVESLLK